MPTIVCQAVGCTCRRKASQFMCSTHWKALPAPLRHAINATWRGWRKCEGDRSEAWLDYMVARDEARRWTADGEGRIGQFEADAPRIRMLREMRAERQSVAEHAASLGDAA